MVDNKPAVEARQGRRGQPVLYVLAASLALLAIALVGLLTWQGETAPKDYASLSQESARHVVTGSGASSSNDAGVPAGNPKHPSPAARTPN